MLVPAWHLLTSCMTLSHMNFLEPGFQSKEPLLDLVLCDSKDCNLPPNMIIFLKTGPMH